VAAEVVHDPLEPRCERSDTTDRPVRAEVLSGP